MMAKLQPAPEQKPCKGLTLECIAAMGCVIPLIATDLSVGLSVRHVYGAPAFWPGIDVLVGQSLPPDPDPPMTLA
nr:hypothetical protein [Sphingomonas sp. CDS-1]